MFRGWGGTGFYLFQFTPLREGRHEAEQVQNELLDFNSRPCVRGDRTLFDSGFCHKKFQFTPLREGRPACWTCIAGNTSGFQFTPLREGRLFLFAQI